jgi:hypothetical protein
VKSTNPDFSLNTIRITMTDQTGSRTTGAFLQNPLAQEINFDVGLAVDRATAATQQLGACELLGNGTFYYKEKDGVKIFGKTFSPCPNNVTKELVFRYYLCADAAIRPSEVNISLLNSSGQAIAPSTDWMFPQMCVGCATDGPLPPASLTATPIGNGIRLVWSPSPESGDVLYYNLYRRRAGTDEMPRSIAILPSPVLFHDDLTTRPANDLVGGVTYLYSVASIGNPQEGCNGPLKPNCSGSDCPLSCVAEKAATVPMLPNTVIYSGKIVRTSVPDVKAFYEVIASDDVIAQGGNVEIISGQTLVIGNNVTIEDGAQVTLQVDPNVQ